MDQYSFSPLTISEQQVLLNSVARRTAKAKIILTQLDVAKLRATTAESNLSSAERQNKALVITLSVVIPALATALIVLLAAMLVCRRERDTVSAVRSLTVMHERTSELATTLDKRKEVVDREAKIIEEDRASLIIDQQRLAAESKEAHELARVSQEAKCEAESFNKDIQRRYDKANAKRLAAEARAVRAERELATVRAQLMNPSAMMDRLRKHKQDELFDCAASGGVVAPSAARFCDEFTKCVPRELNTNKRTHHTLSTNYSAHALQLNIHK